MDCTDHRLRRNLAPCQDEIAKRNLGDAEMVDHAFIDAFEPATQQGDPIHPRPVTCHGLVEPTPPRGQIDQRHDALGGAAGLQNGCFQHIGAQHHASPAARRRVIDIAVFADAMCAQVVSL